MLLARAYFGMNDLDASKRLLSRMANGRRGLGAVHFLLGDIFAARQMFSLAVAEYEAGVLHSDALADRFPELKKVSGRHRAPSRKQPRSSRYWRKSKNMSAALICRMKPSDSQDSHAAATFCRTIDPAVRIAPDPDDPGVCIARLEPGGALIRLSPAQAYLAENMREPYSDVVLIAKCNARFPEHLTLRDLSTLVSRLEAAGMMAGPARDDALSHPGATSESPSAAASDPLSETASSSGPEQETPRRFPNHWSLCRPKPFLDLMLPAVAWMRFLKILVPVAVILAAVGFANNLDLFFADISAIKTRVSYFGRVLFTLFTISLITQIFRGLTARHFRFETPSFGLMLVFGLLPRFNMKIIVPDDADRHTRLWALGAPIYIRFIVFPAGIMTWLAFREQGTVLSQISAGLAMVSMISFLFVSNPLLGGAGYRFLSEWFAVNNLRQKAFARLSSFFPDVRPWSCSTWTDPRLFWCMVCCPLCSLWPWSDSYP